jgi:hypothetical protein
MGGVVMIDPEKTPRTPCFEPGEYDLDKEEGLLCEARSREGLFDVPLAELDEAGSDNRKLIVDEGAAFVREG